MQSIQAVARYFPEKCGGIQVHLNELLPELKRHSIDSKIAASQDQSEPETYEYNGIEVFRYPVFPTPKAEPNHGQFPHGGFKDFANWLKTQKADIYHQHQWTPKCGLPHLRLAKELGMATVVTIHLPQPICQRQTLMLQGQTACDGKINIVRCSRCCDSISRSAPDNFLKLASYTPTSVLSRVPLPASCYLPTQVHGAMGSFVRPFTTPAYVSARLRSLRDMSKFADKIIAVCSWLYDSLLSNELPEEKLALCRYGIISLDSKTPPVSEKKVERSLKIGFIGRWNRAKGIHILVEAIKALPENVDIQLFIHAIANDALYEQEVRQRIGDDQRIHVGRQLGREELSSALTAYDALAVPSQWLETGPLVVLEAYSLGLPVLGSNLGGIAELVKHGVDGLLVPPDNVRAWSEAMLRLATEPNVLNQLQQGIKPVRTVGMEVADLVALYQSLR
ncbi:MAG: glycosyltransferase [Leptolyngbyaceae cyanobacterium MO_188.B28]|nr:glycosyltransferase [Leptolyngbyaceae cyanobacterium MO_188.B28]